MPIWNESLQRWGYHYYEVVDSFQWLGIDRSQMPNPYIVEIGPSVTFTIQDGPIKEVGVNGCQIDDVIRWAKEKIEGFNKNYPCRENSLVITKLDEALLWLYERKREREARNVEGYNKE
jgi:hypothetical protein